MGDEAELAEDLLPAFMGDALEACEFREDGCKREFAVSGQFEGLAREVNNPPEDEFARVPAAVAFLGLLEQDRFFDHAVLFGLGDHAVYGPEQVVSEADESALASLADLDEVVDEYVGVTDGALERSVGRRSDVLRFRGERDNARYRGEGLVGSAVFEG